MKLGKKNKSSSSKKLKYDLALVAPLILVISIVPLIVYLKIVPVDNVMLIFTNGKENFDFFSYFKMQWLLIITLLGSIYYVVRAFLSENVLIRKTKSYYLMAAYLGFALLSTLFAEYKGVALTGFVDRYEGLFVLAAYIALTFLAFNTIDNEKQLKSVLVALGISSLLMTVLGLTQFIDKDFFMTDLGKRLILPGRYEHIADELNFTFAGSRTVYGTLYNINYVGVYMSLVFAVSSTLAILLRSDKYKLFFILTSLASFLMLLGSRSRAGMFSIAVYALLALIFFRTQIRMRWKSFLGIIVAVVLVFFGVNTARDGYYTNILKAGLNSLNTVHEADFKDIVLDDNTATIQFNDYSLKIAAEENGFQFYDENNNLLETTFAENVYKVVDDPYNKHTFTLKTMEERYVILDSTIATNRGGRVIRFVVDDDTEIKVLGYRGEFLDDIKAPSFGFEGREQMASNRGYIWSRSIPMLKNTMLWGHGPDTYALHFPNNDFVGKFLGFSDINMVVDKPHNMYLQIAINTGLTSLVAFLGLVGAYIIDSFKLYLNRKEYIGFIDVAGLGILMAVIVYLFTGLSNDSIVSVAPVFWILLGSGMAVNYKLKEENQK
jgi:O-antigen ligase